MTKIKIGKVYYTLSVDDDTGKTEFKEWIVRSIRKGRVAATWKNSITWGKRSKTIGDFGWLPNTPAWCRRVWTLSCGTSTLHTTKLKAALAELASHKKWYAPEDYDNPEMYNVILRNIKKRISKLRRN